MSRGKISKVLLVVANPENPQDKRGSLVNDLAAIYAEGCQKSGIEVDIIDLYRDNYNPIHYPNRRDTQTIEYQIRMKKVDKVAFFHPVWWGGMPAIMKGFVDKVFTKDFAYKVEKGEMKGTLLKRSLVVSVGRYSSWKMRYFFNNNLETIWQRVIFETVGMKGKFIYFGDYRIVNDGEVNKWHKRIRNIAENQNDSSSLIEMV
jgi:NAD(P)H dehydrogenase (quinone)